MNLSSDLISQFAKITNDGNERKTEEVTLYGEIVQFGDSLCVKLDGSNELTPAITTTAIKVGDRVSAVIKNHTAIITGNFSDPAASSDQLGKVSIDIDQKVGVIFSGLEAGTTIINGACIKTGTIDAKYLKLTGAITFGELSTDVKDNISNALGMAGAAAGKADDAFSRAVDAASLANSAASLAGDANSAASRAIAIASSISVPSYIKSTYIDSAEIRSPTIKGNQIAVYGTFQTMGTTASGAIEATGYMGAARGLDAAENDTFGVALSNSWNTDSYKVGDNYVIVTNGGVRLQAGNNRVVVTPNSIHLTSPNGTIHLNGTAYYNDTEIGTGTAVFG